MSETLEIPLDTVNEWLTKETASIVGPLRAEAKKILEDIKDKLDELSDACDKLLDDAEKEMAKGSRKTYRRAKALYKLAGTFSDLIEEIKFHKNINGKALNQTFEQLKKTVKTIGQEKTKWFRAIAPYFIMSRRRFEVSFKRTEDSFRNYTNFLAEEYAKAKDAEEIPSKINSLRQLLNELNNAEKTKEERKQKGEALAKKITQNQQKLQALQSKGELVELAQLNSRIKELTEKVKHELRHIKKPLLKFQTLVNNPGYSLPPEANSKLEDYLTNPFDALATEKEGYPLLKSILQKIDTALDSKKMKLKPTRLRKAKDQINRIVNKAALESLHNDCKEAFNKITDLSTSGAVSESRGKRAGLNDQLKALRQQKHLLEAREARFEKEHMEARKRVIQEQKRLEKIMSDLSNKTVKLVLN